MKILHVAVHIGGGVGTVVRNWVNNDSANTHTVALLNRNYYGEKQDNIHEGLRYEHEKLKEFINDSDVVVIHFWNHPLLFEFVINFKFPVCRVCVWSHVSALHPPYVHTNKLVEFADKFVLSSVVSNVADIREDLQHKLTAIWTTGGIGQYLSTTRRLSGEDFTIGYIGTLGYSKLHPEFINMCAQIYQQVPNAKFVICGEGYEHIKEEVKKLNLAAAFRFLGRVNVIDVIPTFNVFGYPLVSTHFGTCEQVLGEVLACGVQPIVLNNPAESFILDFVGIVVSDIEEYVSSIVWLSKQKQAVDPEAMLKNRAVELYDTSNMVCQWNSVFEELSKAPKTDKTWVNELLSGYALFIESIGKYGDIINSDNPRLITELFNSNPQWKSNSKGGLLQYLEAFPNDTKLQELTKYL